MSSTPAAPAPNPADLPADLPADSSANLPVDPAADPAIDQPAVAAQSEAQTAAVAEDGEGAPALEASEEDAPQDAEPQDAEQQGAAPGATKQDASQQVAPAATAAKLAELFPALFKGTPKPLKLRIQVDIQERAPGIFTKQALSAFFRRHTGATSYLIAVSKGTQRFDLDGQPAGELSDEHRKVAADELARRRTNANAKRELEEAGRRQRASLLRDIETTKLTTANFCALKGIAPEQLDTLLVQARAEALEDAQRPRRPEHGHGHGQGHPRRNEGGGGRRDAGPGQGQGRGPNQGPNGPRNAPRGGPGNGPRPDQRGPRPGAQARDGNAEGAPQQPRNQEGAPTGEGRREGRPPRRG
jgi:ProP effector